MEGVGLMAARVTPKFWTGKNVLVTGHTGFKGSWMSLWLGELGAHVHGLALAPNTKPNMFELTGLCATVLEPWCDIRDPAGVNTMVRRISPDIVIHMAAQPLVRRAMREPIATFETNVMGTVHLLDALRNVPNLQCILIVTTDKVYENSETDHAFVESDPLGGHDPYAASKAAVEIVVSSYRRTFFESTGIPVATARGGNVIGGGDFSEDRIVPDIWRALQSNSKLILRNPDATRPWQHVLDCVGGYLSYAEALATGSNVPLTLNFGPLKDDRVPVKLLAETLQQALGTKRNWELVSGQQPREMQALALDCSAAHHALGFVDHLVGLAAIEATANWYLALSRGQDMRAITLRAIKDYRQSC